MSDKPDGEAPLQGDGAEDRPAAPVADLGRATGFPMAPEGGSDRFGAMLQPIARALGLSDLGAMLTIVEPGKRAFPFHCHHGNEEMFVILEGSGVYRYGEQRCAVAAGFVCGAPKGGPETAHQLINTGPDALKYLSISTMNDPDVCEYPDSGKLATIAVGEGRDFTTARVRQIGRQGETLDYWDGEDI